METSRRGRVEKEEKEYGARERKQKGRRRKDGGGREKGVSSCVRGSLGHRWLCP